ncbi:MAG: ABC transporter ATP-binding protein [Anaerolineae bacterium]
MIAFERVTFRYPEAETPALHRVTFEIPDRAFAVVAGPSGAGKSTLLRCLNGLIPHFSGGTIAGRVTVDGMNPIAQGPQVMCRHVGFVFQDPETQFVMDRVEDEIAFALENAAMPRSEMRERVEEALTTLDLLPLRRRSLTTLSGGEKQRVAIAAALALRPRILVLDEPTSQLDPRSAQDVLLSLSRLNEALGLTVVLAEHRLERVLSFADHVLYLPGGDNGVRAGPPVEVMAAVDLAPPVVALGKALGWSPLPLTAKAGRRFARDINVRDITREGTDVAVSPSVLSAQDVHAAYNGSPVLRGVNLDLRPGEVTALMGRNGAGKSTLLKTLVGLVKPGAGCIYLDDRDVATMDVAEVCRQVAYLPQDPNALLFADRVRDEMMITLQNHGVEAASAPVDPAALLAELGLTDHADDYPRDLSVGERQRVALAAILITAPRIILLDEPTRGLDYRAKARLLSLVKRWREEGRAVLLVTHDVELIAAAADRVLVMVDGKIAERGAPSDVLSGMSDFAPQVAQLFPGTGWLTVDDVLSALERAGQRALPVSEAPQSAQT